MAAVIGALRVDLGLNSAEFQAGLKKAANGLGNFAKTAGIGLAAVATAAAAAGTALGIAVKGAIDNADRMGEMAQAVGVSVEALTSLGYAAKMSGADTETLATGLRKLSQNMLTVAQGSTGPVAAAFTALGVSVQNANGSLRASDEVLVDLADKFSRMEDGAQKTAIAVQLFGKSGAELIPFLNQGRDGIAELTAEADRLGITISGSTAAAAGDFNDTLDRLRATFDGVVNKIMEAALPALNEFGEKLASPEFAANAQAIGVAIVGAMQVSVDAINTVVGAFNALRGAMEWAGSHDMFGREIEGPGAGNFMLPGSATKAGAMDELKGKLTAGNAGASQGDFYTGIFGSTASELVATNAQVAESFVPVIENTTAAAAGASALKASMAEGKAVFEATRTPAEAYGLEVERLNVLLQKGAVDQDTYNRAVLAAQESFQKAELSGNQLASTLSSSLASVFSSVVDGSKSAVEGIGDLLKSLSDMLIHQGFKSLISGLFSGGGVFSGFKLPGFADGTDFAPGGLAMVGERGPELVNLPRGSQVIPNHDLGATRAGGGRVRLELGPGLKAQILDEAARQSVEVVQVYDDNLGASIGDKSRRAVNGFGGF